MFITEIGPLKKLGGYLKASTSMIARGNTAKAYLSAVREYKRVWEEKRGWVRKSLYPHLIQQQQYVATQSLCLAPILLKKTWFSCSGDDDEAFKRVMRLIEDVRSKCFEIAVRPNAF